MAQNEITLKVAEALSQRDIGQGIARLDPKTMSDLGINERDLIEITGDKKTAAIALPSQTDIGLGVIRIDGLVRKNSGATIGGEVTIKKAQVIEAKKVVLAPTENNIRVQGDVRGLFQGKAMVQGDIIGSQIRTRPTSMGMGFASIVLDEQGKIVFVRDANSKNGTFVNGEKIQSNINVQIKDGDVIRFGRDEYILQLR